MTHSRSRGWRCRSHYCTSRSPDPLASATRPRPMLPMIMPRRRRRRRTPRRRGSRSPRLVGSIRSLLRAPGRRSRPTKYRQWHRPTQPRRRTRFSSPTGPRRRRGPRRSARCSPLFCGPSGRNSCSPRCWGWRTSRSCTSARRSWTGSSSSCAAAGRSQRGWSWSPSCSSARRPRRWRRTTTSSRGRSSGCASTPRCSRLCTASRCGCPQVRGARTAPARSSTTWRWTPKRWPTSRTSSTTCG
uniref:Uncharacterized protein n=1 Tax=Arundo donax TaxID=35708 RepID=A0A0A8Y383_ARUDO